MVVKWQAGLQADNFIKIDGLSKQYGHGFLFMVDGFVYIG